MLRPETWDYSLVVLQLSEKQFTSNLASETGVEMCFLLGRCARRFLDETLPHSSCLSKLHIK